MPEEDRKMMTGLFRDGAGAERAYNSLARRGYTNDDLSILMSDETRRRCVPKDQPMKEKSGSQATEDAGVGAVAGGGLGALLAGLAAAGVAVPGLPIIAVGPLAAAVAGGGLGGALGAIMGALGRGISEDRARRYDDGIRHGGIVMGVTPRTREDAEYLERKWSSCGAEELYCPTWRERDAA